jgi:ABC-type dipeptide/oligopeptide/nickel transport system ATPase component
MIELKNVSVTFEIKKHKVEAVKNVSLHTKITASALSQKVYGSWQIG